MIEGQLQHLPPRAQAILRDEPLVYSPVSLFEVGQKVRVGKWAAMAPHLDGLPDALAAQDIRVASVSPEICLSAATMVWANRDPFDRIIAATSINRRCALLSSDAVFDALDAVARVWH